jgi:hypothetical protein
MPYVSSNLCAGYGVFGTADPYNPLAPNLGALNPPGSLWTIPAPSESGTTLFSSASHGYGSWMTVKYVLYSGSSATTAVTTGPAPVYYMDETFINVSGHYADSVALDAGVAGWLLPNSGTVASVGIGTSLWTSAVLKNNNLGSWVFIAVAGFVPSAHVYAGAAGNSVCGASTADWSVAVTTGILRPCGYIVGTVTGSGATGTGDIIATVGLY